MRNEKNYCCQHQNDAPPVYTQYASQRPPIHSEISRDRCLESPYVYTRSSNGYDGVVYSRGSIQQYSPNYLQHHLQYQDFQTPVPAADPMYAAKGAPSQQLRRPIVIPATAPSVGSPFLRAYPPSLAAFQISRGEFLDVLDGLNRVAVQSPPLHALGLVGEVLGVVPLGTVQTVGLALSATAQVGRVAVSKGATEAYMRNVNREIFAPRGLKMEIAKLEAMARANGFPVLDTEGRISSDARLLQPLLDPLEIQAMSRAQRWLRALEPWVEPLDLETLPPINMDTNLLGRIHTRASELERQRSEKKAFKDRTKAFEKHQKDANKTEEKRAKELAKLEKKEQKARDSHKVDNKLRKIDEKREKADMKHYDRMEKASEESISKDKEAKAMTKVLWLIIRNVHEGSGSNAGNGYQRGVSK